MPFILLESLQDFDFMWYSAFDTYRLHYDSASCRRIPRNPVRSSTQLRVRRSGGEQSAGET
jgi:hypothetical protein